MLKRLPIALAQVEVGNTSEKITKWNFSFNILFILSTRNY